MKIDEVKSLICSLAYDMAKDEAFRNELFNNEADLSYIDEGSTEVYDEKFQPIFDRWYDYFYTQFYDFIFLKNKK